VRRSGSWHVRVSGVSPTRTLDLGEVRLAPRHRCVSLDKRGHGERDKPEGSYATEVFVGDVVHLPPTQPVV
jgi:hypothetical protein